MSVSLLFVSKHVSVSLLFVSKHVSVSLLFVSKTCLLVYCLSINKVSIGLLFVSLK